MSPTLSLDDLLNQPVKAKTRRSVRGVVAGSNVTRLRSQPVELIPSDYPVINPEARGARKHYLAQCERCALWQASDNAFCPSSAPERVEQVTIVVIGEAPGAQEVRNKQPFYGPSGQLLKQAMMTHGLDGSEALLTNTVLCRPAGNADPPDAAIAACSPRLDNEVASLPNLKVVLAVGNTAASTALRRTTKITVDRVGPPRASDWSSLHQHPRPVVAVVPALHPAAVLRSPSAYKDFVGDVGKAARVLTAPHGAWALTTVRWESPKVMITNGPSDARMCIEQLAVGLVESTPIVAVDIETSFDKDDAFEHAQTLTALGICYAPGRSLVVDGPSLQDPQVKRSLEGLFAEKELTFHNGKFDTSVLAQNGIKAKLTYDTMLASYCLDERSGVHRLEYLGRERLATPSWKNDFYARGGFESAPLQDLYMYNGFDAAVTYDLVDPLWRDLRAEGLEGLHSYLVKVSDLLVPIENAGVRVSREVINNLDRRLGESLRSQRSDLARWLKNPGSWQQVMRVLESLGVETPSTDKPHLNAVLENVASRTTTNKFKITYKTKQHFDEVSEFIAKLLAYRQTQKLYGTYVQGIDIRSVQSGDDLVVFPTYKVHGTTTGRLSCANPNMQNIPRRFGMRGMVIAGPGNALVQDDYSGLELRIVACEAEDPGLRAILSDSTRDFMSEVAAGFFGANWTKEQRVKAKTVVHGTNYGRTSHGISKGLNISEAEAQSYIDMYFERFPRLRRWQRQVYETVVEREEHLQTKFGRKRRYYLITPSNEEDVYKEALAFIPQSTGSDICLTAAMKLQQEYSLDVRIPVHDSLLVEAPKEDAEEVGRLMSRVMRETASEFYDYVPFPCTSEVGYAWDSLKEIEID